MVIGDPINVYKDQGPATGSCYGLHRENNFLAIGEEVPAMDRSDFAHRGVIATDPLFW